MKRLTALDAALFCFALVGFGFLLGIRTAITANELAAKRVREAEDNISRWTSIPKSKVTFHTDPIGGDQ